MLDWLLSPIDAARPHEIGFALSWHARLMALSWRGITPVAVLIAWFYKITPNQKWPCQLDNRFWWLVRFLGQLTSFALACIALMLIWIAAQNSGDSGYYHWLGYVIMTLGTLQVLSGFLRGSKEGPTARHADGSLRGDHFDMTPRRLAFERLHKGIGYTALGLIVFTIVTGLWEANAPMWMWCIIYGWWITLLGAGVVLQRQSRAYDTYQAIWGDDPALPGNRIKKQGVGVFRPSECDYFTKQKGDV